MTNKVTYFLDKNDLRMAILSYVKQEAGQEFADATITVIATCLPNGSVTIKNVRVECSTGGKDETAT